MKKKEIIYNPIEQLEKAIQQLENLELRPKHYWQHSDFNVDQLIADVNTFVENRFNERLAIKKQMFGYK